MMCWMSPAGVVCGSLSICAVAGTISGRCQSRPSAWPSAIQRLHLTTHHTCLVALQGRGQSRMGLSGTVGPGNRWTGALSGPGSACLAARADRTWRLESQERPMADPSKERTQAEAQFKKAQRAPEGAQAMSEYSAEQQANVPRPRA
jgi:hypothetical protein